MNQVKTAELVRSWQSPERSRFLKPWVAAWCPSRGRLRLV